MSMYARVILRMASVCMRALYNEWRVYVCACYITNDECMYARVILRMASMYARVILRMASVCMRVLY